MYVVLGQKPTCPSWGESEEHKSGTDKSLTWEALMNQKVWSGRPGGPGNARKRMAQHKKSRELMPTKLCLGTCKLRLMFGTPISTFSIVSLFSQ